MYSSHQLLVYFVFCRAASSMLTVVLLPHLFMHHIVRSWEISLKHTRIVYLSSVWSKITAGQVPGCAISGWSPCGHVCLCGGGCWWLSARPGGEGVNAGCWESEECIAFLGSCDSLLFLLTLSRFFHNWRLVKNYKKGNKAECCLIKMWKYRRKCMKCGNRHFPLEWV